MQLSYEVLKKERPPNCVNTILSLRSEAICILNCLKVWNHIIFQRNAVTAKNTYFSQQVFSLITAQERAKEWKVEHAVIWDTERNMPIRSRIIHTGRFKVKHTSSITHVI